MKKFVTYVFIGILSFLLSSCSNEIDVYTGDAFNITDSTAQITCTIETDDISDIDEFGVLFSTSEMVVNDHAGIEAKTNDCNNNTYIVFLYLSDLTDKAQNPGTKFYYCSYVISGHNYYYGDIKSFSTPK